MRLTDPQRLITGRVAPLGDFGRLLGKLNVDGPLLGGIPRLIYYRDFEWSHFADKMQVPALIAKHIVAFAILGVGVWLWRRLRATAEAIAKADAHSAPRT